MENATKALIMAGTVLISILLISFLVLFLRKGASASAEYYNAKNDEELARFNAQFEVYDRKNNTYFDVITVLNLVYDLNKKGITISATLYDGNNTYVVNGGCSANKFINGKNIYDFVEDYTEIIDKKYVYLFKCSNKERNWTRDCI